MEVLGSDPESGGLRMSWNELKEKVADCSFSDCPRNNGTEEFLRLPILFDRTPASLDKIKFVVVSQDPGADLRKRCDPEKIEEFLIKECKSDQCPKKSNGLFCIFG